MSVQFNMDQLSADVPHTAGHVPLPPVGDDPDRTAPPTAPSEPAGTRFAILRPYARGGLGLVSVALDQELHREVALKEIQERHADKPETRTRFILEAEITGGLEHPGIVPVYGLGAYGDGRPFYAMRFIRGDSLQTAIANFHDDERACDPGERVLELRQLLHRFIDVCNAIEYAHAKGVLHRDLKPGNIMLGNYGETLVVDWGLAKVLGLAAIPDHGDERPLIPTPEADAVETQMGATIGTPAYMSPEQAAGRLDLLSAASDVYSLGATLYTLLTGRPPIDGERDPDIRAAWKEQELAAGSQLDRRQQWAIACPMILQKAQAGDIVRPRQVNRGIPPALEAICLKAMALRRQDRYGSARALADDLEHWLADEPVAVHREPWTETLGRWARRHRAWTRAAAAALLVVAAVSCIAAALIDRARANEIRVLRINESSEDFIRGLDAVDWNDQHLAQMDAWLTELAALDFDRLEKYRLDLIDGFVYAIQAAIQQPGLTERDIARLKGQIEALQRRSPAAAPALRGQLAQRERIWQPVFELAAPFVTLGSVFPLARVRVVGDAFQTEGVSPTELVPLLTSRISSEGNVRLESRFAAGWEAAHEVGLVLNASGANRYEFVVAARSSGDMIDARLIRSGIELRMLPIRASSGPLTLLAAREGDRLVFQINDHEPLEFDDPFALSTASPGVFGLIAPDGVRIERLTARRQALPASPSPLEQGDELYSTARYDAALAYYQAAMQTSPPDQALEPRYKAALCLDKLRREKEASTILEGLVAQLDSSDANHRQEWAVRAACQLWSLRVRQRNWRLADQILPRLIAQYSLDELARLVPADERELIHDEYRRAGMNPPGE